MPAKKYPISRRQKWEDQTKRSRYEVLRSSQEISKVNQHTKVDDVVDICPAGAVLSRLKNEEITHSHHQADQVDTPRAIPFSWYDILLICFSVLFYIADVGTDCFLAYKHYLDKEEHPLYFGFTVAFVVLSGTVTCMFSLWWYYFEYQTKKESMPDELPSGKGLAIRIAASVLWMGPVVRYIDTIIYGMQSRKRGLKPKQRQYYYEQMQFERVDGAMLRLLEAFLESAPQFLLQVYIVLENGLDGEKERNYLLVTVTIVSITTSMLSLAWSVVAYHKALRMSRADLQTVSHFGLFFRFLWRLFEISPRVIILAMFMSASSYHVAIVFSIHYILMAIWLSFIRTNFCEKKVCENFFVMVMAFVWSFCFFNLKDGHTRKTSLIYYTLFYLENVGMTIGWHYMTIDQDIWYRNIIMPIVLASIVPMVASMLIYYKFLHKQKIETWLPLSYWKSCSDEPTPDSSISVPTEWYNSRDGSGVERQGLTRDQSGGDLPQSPNTPIKLGSTPDSLGPEYIETSFDQLERPNDMPGYRAPTPEPTRHSFRQSTEIDTKSQSSDIKPNLDDCIEVDGYLESTEVMGRHHSKVLQRQDTLPKYTAPAPPSTPANNYGATVPGGAHVLFKHSVPPPAPADPKRGSTLPGATSTTAVMRNEKFVPYEDEENENAMPELPPRQSSTRQSSLDKPPVPQPRHSAILHNETECHHDINLTTVSELSGDQSTLLRDSRTPSFSTEQEDMANHHEKNINDITVTENNLDDSIVNITTVNPNMSMDISLTQNKADNSILNRTASRDNVSMSSIDTPLRDGNKLDKNLQLSPDTPIKDAIKTRKNHQESILET